MKAIRFHPLARLEINDARKRSLMISKFETELDDRIELIRQGITTFSTTMRGARQTILTRLPYSIIYTDETNEIFIVAFAHHKRKPGYWKQRLKA